MKRSRFFLLTLAFVIIHYAFNIKQAIPAEIQGKWKLRGQSSKLIGTLEIKGDGTYIYSVLPNFKETGSITANASRQPKQIDLIAKRSGGGINTTPGIYKLTGSSLQLSLGKMNGSRPANFTGGTGIIVWVGTK